jgi:hypothetical protein
MLGVRAAWTDTLTGPNYKWDRDLDVGLVEVGISAADPYHVPLAH